jgi:hypothetical protein
VAEPNSGIEITLEWWTPEGAELVCSLCKECRGWEWRKENPIEALELPPCPIASIWCG